VQDSEVTRLERDRREVVRVARRCAELFNAWAVAAASDGEREQVGPMLVRAQTWRRLAVDATRILRMEPAKALHLWNRIKDRYFKLRHGDEIRAGQTARSAARVRAKAPRNVERNTEIREAATALQDRHPRETAWQVAGRLAPRFELSQKRVAQIINDLWESENPGRVLSTLP